MKIKTLLIAAVMFLGISVAAFAQAQYAVSASPVTTGVNTGVTEKVGDIGFNTLDASGYTVTGTIAVDFGRKITAPIADPGGIRIVYFNPDPAPLPAPIFGLSFDSVVNPTKVIISVKPAAGLTPAQTARLYSFRLTGVRVDVSGNTDVSVKVDASITATSNMIVNGQATATVLVGTAPAFYSLTNNTVVFDVLGAQVSTSNVATLDLLERFAYAMHVTPVSDATQNDSQTICFALDGDIPTGITLTFGAASTVVTVPGATSVPAGAWTRLGTGVITAATTPKRVCYDLAIDTDIAAIEHVYVPVTVTAQSALVRGSVYPTSGAPLYALATLAPFSTELATGGSIPRYNPAYPKDWVKSNMPIFDISGSDATVLMIPYAVSELGYDTGITIANTAADPGAAAGITSPLPQTGPITFYLYPNNGAMISISSTEIGKEFAWGTDGKVPPGKSYILLLSELLAAAGYDDVFSGYIIAYCNFTHAHGQYFVSDFDSFSNGALMLVMNPERATLAMESLGQ